MRGIIKTNHIGTASHGSIGDQLSATKGRPTGFDYVRVTLGRSVVFIHVVAISCGVLAQTKAYNIVFRPSLTQPQGFEIWL